MQTTLVSTNKHRKLRYKTLFLRNTVFVGERLNNINARGTNIL